MVLKQNFISFLLGFACCVWTLAASTLQDKEIDSLFIVYTDNVYENPNASIEFGLSVFNHDSNSERIKIRGLMLLSLAYTSKRDYQKALEYTITAKEKAEHIPNDPKLNIDILLRTGILYQQLKIFDKSMEFLDKTEQLCIAYPNRKAVAFALGSTYIVKGFIYKDNLNCDIALIFFEKGIAEYKKLEVNVHQGNLSIAYYNMGNCYTVLSQYGNAKNSFYKSLSFAKLQKASSLIGFAQKGLAEVYTLEGKYQESIDLLHDAFDQSSNVGDIVLYQGIYKGLFENYLALNQWEEYQTNYLLFLKTQLAIKESERNSVSNSIDDNSKAHSEKLHHIKSNYNSNLKFVIVLIILIIIAVVFFEIKNRKVIKSLQNTVKTIQSPK